MDPATLALISAGISAGGSALGGIFGRGKESRGDKQKRELIDQLLASVKGNGPFSDMFKSDDATFQKSFVDPAKKRFKDQIAPQIQQSYIANGQQRGTGLDDTLSRAGVDLDQMLNQQYMDFQNRANDRSQNAISTILGSNYGQGNQSRGSAAGQGAAGYLSSAGFGSDISAILGGFNQQSNPKPKSRAGFSDNDFDYYP